jgi:hypothetical protein
MSTRFGFPLLAVTLLGALGALGPSAIAHADDNLLHGPHPFLKENDLSAHVLIANGLGSSMSGAKLAFDYGYRVTSGRAPLGIDLALNLQQAACTQTGTQGPCGPDTGTLFETLAGVRWKFQTPIPLVPFVAAAGGLVFSFPNGADAAAGPMARVVGGANYFFFDWLGLGVEAGLSLGYLDYDSTFTGGSRAYNVFDVGGGVEFQF